MNEQLASEEAPDAVTPSTSEASTPSPPARPPTLPREARWLPDHEKWEVATLDAAGVKQGDCRLYREDGSLFLQTRFVDGQEDGPFTIFHPSGEIARAGQRRAGELDGGVVARIATVGEGEPLRSCCVPGPAVEMRSQFSAGQMVYERFYDREGRLLLSDGSLCPDRPANLPETAEYDEGGHWIVAPAAGAADRLTRLYRQDGSLAEEAIIEDGWKTFSRQFASDGSVAAELRCGRDGRREGLARRRYVDGDASPYLDARIVEERGAYTADRPAGRWTFHDATGAEVRTVVHEPAQGTDADGDLDAVFGNQIRDAAGWLALAQQLIDSGQTARACCAAARAAARAGQADDLIAFLAAHTVALAEPHATQLTSKAVEKAGEAFPPPGSDPQTGLLSALAAGGAAAELFRALSGLHRSAPRAALDLAEAALLLAPDGAAGYLTRALARLELGDDRGALADAGRLQEVSPETADFLRGYTAVLFPKWEFWPARESWGEPPQCVEGMPDEPGQPLGAIVRVMQVYATRLLRLREAVLALAPHRDRATWLPPAPSDLLPAGPLALTRWETTIVDQTDEGPETVAVTIDETLDCAGLQLPALMRLARVQWAALTWLTWAVGRARVELPASIEPPAGFSPAAIAAITRYFRVQDTLATGGLRSRTQDVPGFAWHGVDIDELPRPVAEVVLQEALELRALFLWLLSPENHSPFQSDLRDGGV
jgi:hypothetical protein